MSEDTVTVRVHHEAWINGQAVEVDDSPVEFSVPRNDAEYEENGELVPDKHWDSDLLRQHENAPNRASDWFGPFWVEVVADE